MPCSDDPSCIRYSIAAEIPILDPHIARSPEAGIIFRQVFDSLVYRDSETHEYRPGLAREWRVSSDGLHYTFDLRQGLSFHDGAPFNAAAVAANIERIYDPALPDSYARELLGPLTQFEVLGAHSIRLTLASPFPTLLDSLAQPYLGIASPVALAAYSDLRHQFHLAGTGPFRLVEYLPGERAVLERNEEYRVVTAETSQVEGRAIGRIEFLFSRGVDVGALAELSQHVDVIDNVSPADAQNLAGNSRVQLLPTEVPGTAVHILFNTRREHLSRRDVRLALLLATNRVAIIDQAFFNFSPVAWAPLSESTRYSHTGYINRFAFDRAAAQQLLQAAGYSDSDGDGILDMDGAALTLSLVAPPWGRLPEVATILQSQWRALGIDLRIVSAAGETAFEDLIQSGQIDLIPVQRYGVDPQSLNSIYLASGEFAASRLPITALDEALLAAGRTLDPELRRSQVYAIQSMIMDEVLMLPIRETVRLSAARADLVNLRFDAYGFYPLLYDVRVASG